MLLLLREELLCDTFLSLKHLLSLERMLLVSSFFFSNESAWRSQWLFWWGSKYHKYSVSKSTGLGYLCGWTRKIPFISVAVHTSKHTFSLTTTVIPRPVCFRVLPSHCWATAGWCCAGSLFCLCRFLFCSSHSPRSSSSGFLFLVWFCVIEAAGDKAVTSERHSSSKELKQISGGFSLPIFEQYCAKLDFKLVIFS